MIATILSAVFLIPTATFILAGILANNNDRLASIMKLTKIATSLGLVVSGVGAALVFSEGVIESPTIGLYEIGISFRFDALSIIMYSMVSIIALVVIRFSYNYLDGDTKHSIFIGRLSIAIAFVQLLLLSGNLFILFFAWVAMSLALHKLLIFYPERIKAKLGARKKFIVARLGDASLLVALSLIYLEFGTGNLEVIFRQIQTLQLSEAPIHLEVAAILLVITAGLKSAQFPLHGWLLEVMEAPTPVSALLHAGLLNAGPFLMIRFAFLLDIVQFAPYVLFTMGAVTAMYGTLIFTTQPTVKTALAYSSVAHMGFSMMVCGLGVYSASLLHLIAHSFYKAHSFLSSGSMVELVRVNSASTFSRKGSFWRILSGFSIAIFLFLSLAAFWWVDMRVPFQLVIISGIILTGIISLLINAIDSSNYISSIIKAIAAAIVVLMFFFGFEELIRFLLGNQVPEISAPSQTMKYLSGITLAIFFLTVLSQTLSPAIQKGSYFKSFGVHVRNGFYVNVVFDRLMNALNQNDIDKEYQ